MRTLTIILMMVCAIAANGKDLVVIDKTRSSHISKGEALLYSEQMDSLGKVDINLDGKLRMPDSGWKLAEINTEGFEPRLLNFQDMSCDTVFMKPVKELSEIVITPENVKEYGDHTSYRIPMTDMRRYNNVMMALNVIPHLTILSSGNAYFEGSPDIKFLLNGVDTNEAELRTISKEDIFKIDVYKNPSARFAAQGYATVIDVRTKSGLRGGNIGVDIDQAFYPLFGDNYAALYYNYRRSRFSVVYSNENRHFNKNRDHEDLRYDFEGTTYEKSKRGRDSKFVLDNNTLSISFQNNNPQDYLYNVQAGMSINRKRDNTHQLVTSNNNEFEALNKLHSSYNRFNIANYFEKSLGKEASKGKLIANINLQHYDTRFKSTYQEYENILDNTIVDVWSAYKTRLDGVFTDIQYEFPANKAGYFAVNVFDEYKHSHYKDTFNPFHETVNNYGANATWFGSWQKIQWYASIGIHVSHTSTTMMEKSRNVVTPTPRMRLTWRPSKTFQFRAGYSYYAVAPSIAQLSETDQWLDTKLVYHGNARLKTYKNHTVSLGGIMDSKYVDVSLMCLYNFAPGMICSMYGKTEKYMLETIVNLNRYSSMTGELTVTLKPLGNDKLSWWNHLIAGDLRGSNSDYKWHGTRFQWMSSLDLNLEKWSVSAYYQYPGKVPDGQLIRPRAQCWSLSGYYRPIPDLSIGLRIFMPFGKSFKESEYTVADSPVYYKNESENLERANSVTLQISWNMSFGRKRNYARPKFSHPDSDSGLLHK